MRKTILLLLISSLSLGGISQVAINTISIQNKQKFQIHKY